MVYDNLTKRGIRSIILKKGTSSLQIKTIEIDIWAFISIK